MKTKINLIFGFFYVKSIFFLLNIFILQVNAETKIIAKRGDTLLKLSKQYSVPLKELMHKNNFNDANRLIEGEVIFIPQKNNLDKKDENSKHITYKVKEGDTLYKIARDHSINIKEIISINNFDNVSYLKQNQIILIPFRSEYKDLSDKKNLNLAMKKVPYHQTSKSEKLVDIALIHSVSKDDIINLNKLNNPIKVNPNTKLKIRNYKPYKWLKYGSIIVNWSDWRYLDGNYITQAKNRKNKPFYLSINCKKRVFNNTLNHSYWTKWYFPENNFEFKLLNDFCDKDFEI